MSYNVELSVKVEANNFALSYEEDMTSRPINIVGIDILFSLII